MPGSAVGPRAWKMPLCAGLVVVACAKPALSKFPEVAGYRPGETWAAVGRTLPCWTLWRGRDDSRLLRKYPQLGHKIRWCQPADSILLTFIADTLWEIQLKWEVQPLAPGRFWADRLAPRLASSLGAPDSVATSVDTSQYAEERRVGIRTTPNTVLTARWQNHSAWRAMFVMSGADSIRFPDMTASPLGYSGTFVLTGCVSHESLPLCRADTPYR